MKREFFNSYGIIDRLDITDRNLSVDGWVGSPEAVFDELTVTIDEVLVTRFNQPWLNSADVKAAWPQLINAEKCRFALRVHLTESQLDRVSAGGLIGITPEGGGQRGVPLVRLWPLSFGAAHTKESDEVGQGDFTSTSFEFLSLFRQLAGLKREEQVLDAGCGIGRMAFALAHYLKPTGRYDGFDVCRKFVDSAKLRFSGLPHFNFTHVDVFNLMYNPHGKRSGDAFEFPYADSSFDFVFLTSVFTHMVPRDISNYLSEISRVIRPSGRCLATFFVLDAEAETNIEDGRASLPLRHRFGNGCRVRNPSVPEEAIAYPLDYLRSETNQAGLEISQLHLGQWAGRANFLTYQDICVLKPLQK